LYWSSSVVSGLFGSFRVFSSLETRATEPISPLKIAPYQYFYGGVGFRVEGPAISIPRQFSGRFLITNSIVTCFIGRHG